MKKVHYPRFLFLRIMFSLFIFSSFVFGACTLTIDPRNATVLEGEKVTIKYSTSGCSDASKYLLQWKTDDATAHAGSDFPSDYTSFQSLAYGFRSDVNGNIAITPNIDSVDDDGEYFQAHFELYQYKKKWWQSYGSYQLIESRYSKITIKDTQPISIQTENTNVYEGETAKIRVYASGDIPNGKSINVHYYTADDTAIAGTNYTSTSGDITFTSTHTEEYVNVVTINDGVTPTTDPLKYKLYIQTSSGIGHGEQGIKNVESIAVGFIDSTYTGTEDSKLKFIVKISGTPHNAIKLRYYTKPDGTATSQSDYTETSGEFEFPANTATLTKTIEVPLKKDDIAEGSEDFSMYLSLISPSSGVKLTKSKATGIIEDIKPDSYVAKFTQTNYVGNEGNDLIFSVRLDKKPKETIRISYETTTTTPPNTATSGSDFTPVSSYLDFTPTSPLTQTFSVPLKTDTDYNEYDEIFYVTLSSSYSNLKIPSPKATGTIKGKTFDDEDVIDGCANPYDRCVFDNTKETFDLVYGGTGNNAYGDLVLTGESIMCPTNGGVCDWNYKGKKEWMPTKAINESDVLRSAGYNNSSEATLKLPNVVDEKKNIVFARLYWQGNMSRFNAKTPDALKPYIKGWSHIAFVTPDGNIHKLSAKKDDTNWYSYTKYGTKSGGRFFYQANVDVTDIVKEYIGSDYFKNTKNKTFAAGGIVASTEGKPTTMVYHNKSGVWHGGVAWGHWGGWSLVVAYEVSAKEAISSGIKYKNVAVYNGYRAFMPWTTNPTDKVTIEVDGFYTPTEGEIDSTLSYFAGSANGWTAGSTGGVQFYNPDTDIEYDLSNSINPVDNPVNGTFSYKGEDIYKGRRIHAGTNLDTLDISDKMTNKQTSAKISLYGNFNGTYAYSGFTSLLTFTTEIYSPKVCYEEHIYYKGKQVPTEIIPYSGSTLTTQVEIRNEGHEDAEKIHVFSAFDTNYTYQDDSLLFGKTLPDGKAETPLVPNSPLTHIIKPNEFGDVNISMFVGRGASSSEGGTLKAMKSMTPNPYDGDSARFDYNMTFYDQNFTTREYHAEYVNEALKLTYKGQIFECVDTNRSFNTGILGEFNAVSRVPSSTMTDNPRDSKNSLYTQISQKPFTVYIVSLYGDNPNKKPTKFTGNVKVDLVGGIDYSSCGENDDECQQTKCNAPDDASPVNLNFNNEKYKTHVFTVANAVQSAMVRMRYTNSVGKSRCSTSLDIFSVRPQTYKTDLEYPAGTVQTPPYVGGRAYTIKAKAVTDTNTIANYNANPVDMDLNTNYPATCPAPAIINPTVPISFNNGEVVQPVGLTSKNIGLYKFSIKDNKWTSPDQTNKSDGAADCIVGSHENTPSSGKVGCDVYFEAPFTFIPAKFRIHNLNIQNANIANDFTYISNNANMMATLTMDLEALLDDLTPGDDTDNLKATAFDEDCYAVTIPFALDMDNATPTGWARATTPQADISYSNDPAVGSTTVTPTNPTIVTTTRYGFALGVARPNLRFNFSRTINSPDNPFVITPADFDFSNLQDQLTPAGYAPNIHTNPAADNANFYYGRVWAPDVEGVSPVTNVARFEVYCTPGVCNPATYALGDVNPISNEWYLNTNHTVTDGNIITIAETLPNPVTTTTNPAGITNGLKNNIVLTAPNNTTAYVDTIQMTPSQWLVYSIINPLPAPAPTSNDFRVEFLIQGQWAGQGDLGVVIEDAQAPRTNRRMEW